MRVWLFSVRKATKVTRDEAEHQLPRDAALLVFWYNTHI